jgi:hypothetical protein
VSGLATPDSPASEAPVGELVSRASEQLTVDELSHRVDPREQVKSAARAGSEAVRSHRGQLAIAGGLVSVAVLARVIARRRSSHDRK